ncbi:hypothetical protein IW140_003361 [Coemansia sp. RSA 1813]|nr:hypothetical protein EV178_003180 [Coemansia sp. RSA 1646]KAJ1770987.1 hypothetical protein LPJ74_002678 [Coemansia sp. RSA 1843]KAJ2089226.1 hypothetical protein IW138_003546 [Coemansia sp. RSA 986]KAJ2215056.1 hypothetical protein EV179_002424 [Coemansia sp. RSA 487]KAJ2568996.1 hypothetical protein IW140_003361 [Coemansia sp. RSA 1813]
MSLLSACANTVGLVLFTQSVWSAGWQLIRRDPLVAPEAPVDVLRPRANSTKRKTLPSNMEALEDPAHLEISKAVHPHLYSAQRASEITHSPPSCSALSRKLKRAACGFDCDKIARTKGYTSIVPFLSIQLAFAQALMGLIVTLLTMVWQLSDTHQCHPLPVVIVFHVGLGLLFFASAVQTHLANAMCIKIFIIVGLALGTHFTMLGLMISNSLIVNQFTGTCTISISQPSQGWLANLPAYSAVSHFFVFFFSSISFINGGFRLSTKSKDFLSFREIVYVFLVYRGVGLLFIANIVGLLLSTVAGVLAALKLFQFMPLWIIQWCVVSRIHVLALECRATTDRSAHLHAFWRSQEYVASHMRLPEPLGPCDSDPTVVVGGLVAPAGRRGFLATATRLLFATPSCQKECCSSIFQPHTLGAIRTEYAQSHRQQTYSQAEATPVNNSTGQLSIAMDNYATRTSRHDTVVEDDVRF